MANFLPHSDNLLHFYDYRSYEDGANTWKNELKDNNYEIDSLTTQYYIKKELILCNNSLTSEEKQQALHNLQKEYYEESNGLIYIALQKYKDLTLNGASYNAENNAIYLPQKTGYGYVQTELGNTATMYAVVKFLPVKNFNGTTWGITVCSNSSSNRLYYGQDASTYQYCCSIGSTSTTLTDLSLDWGVLCLTVKNGVQKFYLNGKLVATFFKENNYNLKWACINNGTTDNNKPPISSPYSTDMYVKSIAIFNCFQEDIDVIENSEELAIRYKLKSNDKIRLSGTDAVISSYIMNYNQERIQTLENLKNNYIEGVQFGDKNLIIQEGQVQKTFNDNGLIGYFDLSSLDIENQIWYNQILGQNNIPLLNKEKAYIEDNALKAVGDGIGDFICKTCPKVIYMVLKKDTFDDNKCILHTKQSSPYCSIWDNSHGYQLALGGSPYIQSQVNTGEYICLTICFLSRVQTNTDGALNNICGAELFVNGAQAGILTDKNFITQFLGTISFLRKISTSNTYSNQCIQPTFLRFIGLGTEELPIEDIIFNSKFLVNKYIL